MDNFGEREGAQLRSQQASLEPLLRALGFVPANSGSDSESEKVSNYLVRFPLDPDVAPLTTKSKGDFNDFYLTKFSDSGQSRVALLWHAIGYKVRRSSSVSVPPVHVGTS